MKSSSIIHHDSFGVVHSLPDDVAGRFAKALAGLMEGIDYTGEDQWVNSLLHPFRGQFQRDAEKYQAACERNRLNAVKGGRPKNIPVGFSETQNIPVGFSETHLNPKYPDNDNDNGSGSDNGKEKLQGENPPGVVTSKKKETNRFTPPTPSEVDEYCRERNNGISGQQFVDWNQAKGWLIGKGEMKDWRAAVRTWESKRKENQDKQTQSTGHSAAEETKRMLARMKAEAAL